MIDNVGKGSQSRLIFRKTANLKVRMLGNENDQKEFYQISTKLKHNIYIHFCTLHTLTNKNLGQI